MLKTLAKIRYYFLFALPAVLFCSYYPNIMIGSSNSMNFDLSLTLIWLAILALLSLPAICQKLWQAFTQRKIWLLSLLFPIYLTLTILWSPNQLRALLTAGIFWCIYIAVLSIFELKKSFTKKQRSALTWTILITSVVFALWCWVQCLLDIIGVGRAQTLLCAGCTYQSFGFPHPNGLAIEPQFMGNLLIAPTLFAFWVLYREKITKRWQRYGLVAIALFLSATLFLTFSRGAIYAFVVALIVFIIWAIKQKKFRIGLVIIPIVAFSITLVAQGCMSAISPAHETFSTGVAKVIHQLSLGKIDLRNTEEQADSPEPTTQPSQSSVAPSNSSSTNKSNGTAETNSTSQFSGYVEASTDIRVNLTNKALELWSSDFRIILFGVGLGGAGTALHTAFPDDITTAKEIVQNEYASLLLETGLLGVIFAIIIFIFFVKYLWQSPKRPLLISIIAAYLITLFFFSGLPNALQIYLWLPLLI